MQKELIYDKMNGFWAEGMVSMPEGIENEFAEGKECCLLYDGRNPCERLGLVLCPESGRRKKYTGGQKD